MAKTGTKILSLDLFSIQIILLALKVVGLLNIRWYIILIPIEIILGFVLVMFGIFILMLFLALLAAVIEAIT